MIFADLQAGQAVFLDANVFVYHSTHDPQYGAACTDLLDRCERQEISAFTSTHVVSEAAHRLIDHTGSLRLLGRPQAGIAQFLRKHPAEVRKLSGFRKTLEGISQSAIRF